MWIGIDTIENIMNISQKIKNGSAKKKKVYSWHFISVLWNDDWLSNYFQDSLIHNEQIIFPDFQKEN